MSGWTAKLAIQHHRKMRQPTPDLTKDEPAEPAPKPTGRAPLPYIVVGAPRTKKNSLRMIKRGGRMKPTPSAAYCAWHERAEGQAYRIKAEMRAAGIELPIARRVTVVAVFYQDANWRADECGYMQALGDWLQDVGIVENDRFIHWGGIEITVDHANPGIEFGVTL